MKKTFRLTFFLIMLLVCLVCMVPNPAEADSWPSLSSSKYCEFVAAKPFNAYRDSALKTRGTASPAKSYGAAVYEGDVCRIYEITSSYVKLGYPTSSGYKTAYVSRSNVLPASSVQATTKAGAEVTVYSTPGGSKYGYTEVGDAVYKVGTSGDYTAIIYTAKSGSRAYKFGYVKTSQYKSHLSGKSSSSSSGSSNTSSSSGGWQWPVSGASTSQGFNNYSNSMAKKGRPYHSGVDLVSSNRTIVAAAGGTVKYKGYSSGNGNHVILAHTVSGKTVYTLYAHLENYSSCPAVGSKVTKGQKIGTMGNTGNSTGVHLHFAVFSGYSSDPYGYVSSGGSNKMTYNGMTFYSPSYVIKNNKLP